MSLQNMIDEALFHKLATGTLQALEQAATDLDDRLEADLAADILTLEFAEGAPAVINSHTAARQIWMSANREAWHFDPDPATGRWTDTKGRGELWAVVSQVLSGRLGRALTLRPPGAG